ncbi:MAG: hypothetical protein ABW069_20900 [Duganella sp.]
MPTILPLSLLTIGAALTGAGASAIANNAPATFTPEMLNMLPPPGLYRLEVSQGVTRFLGTPMTISEHKDGVTGTATTITDNGDSRRVTTATGGRSTTCRRMGQQAVPEPAPFSAPDACKNLSVTLDGNTLTFVDQCSIGRMTSTVRRLSETTWENTFDVAQPVPGPGDAWGLPELLEAGGTPDQRELARQLRRLKIERDAQAAADISKARAALNSELLSARTAEERASTAKVIKSMDDIDARKPAIHRTNSERWTLVSRQCGAGQPGHIGPASQR